MIRKSLHLFHILPPPWPLSGRGRLTQIAVLVFLLMGFSCTKKGELGTEANPVKLYFTPSVDAKVIESNSIVFKAFLERNTPYKYEISLPQSFIAVVEAFGTKRADIAAMNSFGYVLAHKKYGAEARMTVLRHGASTYQSQFVVKADTGIKSLADLAGKRIAFVDPASATGYLLPLKTLKEKKIEPKETVFAMKHDSVISMVYQGQVDAGATFYSPPTDGKMEDARRLVLTQYPDVESKVKILELSEHIANDPVVFRKEMSEEMKSKITDAFLAFIATDEGKVAFKAIYNVDGLKRATDSDYDKFREMLATLGKDAEELMKK
ncbi:MAG: phosphate/phosphite/phosphonate ABC transporter substrate-binding protein [Bdellovibrionales bacterium]|jgi:phosphonate transport system substrate-binding protein|nr:phosphate/phosphite/phosphonate ABC transporter substrate-binding protein [Bdellovibrionales bacterium]